MGFNERIALKWSLEILDSAGWKSSPEATFCGDRNIGLQYKGRFEIWAFNGCPRDICAKRQPKI
jgi:hypothetical protein